MWYVSKQESAKSSSVDMVKHARPLPHGLIALLSPRPLMLSVVASVLITCSIISTSNACGIHQFVAHVICGLLYMTTNSKSSADCADISVQVHTLPSAGGGAIEMELSKFLRDYSRTVAGKEQMVIAAIAKALEIIPRTLCDNAGFDSTNILNRLREKHSKGERLEAAVGLTLPYYPLVLMQQNPCYAHSMDCPV